MNGGGVRFCLSRSDKVLGMSKNGISKMISSVRGQSLSREELTEKSVKLAGMILEDASDRLSVSERYQAWKLSRMMKDPAGKALTLTMADQVFRPKDEARSAAVFRRLIDDYGVPIYLPVHERIAMRVGGAASTVAPEIVMPAVTSKMRAESDKVILPSEDSQLKPHLAKRRKEGTRMNINQLGEAILGEGEAEHRLQQVIERLESPECEYISVKISAIFSQINLVAYDQTVKEIQERLRRLYRTAMKHEFVREDGTKAPKFVNLDMEEYRDLHLTCESFKATLMEPEFLKMRAGIVLQAYLPDSFEVQKDLTEWARKRVAAGGETIKIRIVKGANLAMERVEASIHDWTQAPYFTKDDVDANFKRMVTYGCEPENAKVVAIGVASHNLFDIAHALLLRESKEVVDFIEFEMLEGMANHQARSVREAAKGLLLYAPVVKEEDFHSAIAYLVRRLDENTHEENFLHDLFSMSPGSPEWNGQRDRFTNAMQRQDLVSTVPNRTQDRASELAEVKYDSSFENEADTDWSLRHNVDWVRSKVAPVLTSEIPDIPLVIAGGEQKGGEAQGIGNDPSTNYDEIYRYEQADEAQVNQALQTAVDVQPAWEALGPDARAEFLKQAAAEMANRRGESIAVMVREAGKAIPQGDAEVSEAIDFANYYAESLNWDGMFDGSSFKALGVVVITPPWNFPYAIPCGGILAALMAGNTVILKPAPEAVLTAWTMVNHLWDAGIPKDVLQFVACPDNHIGRSLVTDDRVGAVILTGAYETGRMFLGWKPNLRLYAETSGKNSLIITASADPDLAIKDLVYSAFAHAGQKCSAASLAILESAVYDDPNFLRQLKDAAASLKVGPSSDPSSIVTPVIRNPGEDLLRGLTELDEGEEWLLEPQMVDGNPCLWTPGIRLGVRADSWFRRTECFGPVLGLVRARNLEHAIAIQNDSEFGLTGGIHSLDPLEIAEWRETVEVGNAYINRPITGAIVRRQPFGGWKRSCFGPGSKAGGPNYVAMLGKWSQESLPQAKGTGNAKMQSLVEDLVNALPESEDTLRAAAGSYAKWWNEEFSVEHDPSGLLGENNHFRYVPAKGVIFRADQSVSDEQLLLALLAGATCGVTVDFSLDAPREVLKGLPCTSLVESEARLIARMPACAKRYGFLRALSTSLGLGDAANDVHLPVVDGEVLSNGRIELLNYLREQAISQCTHRYGNLIPSAKEVVGLRVD